MKLAGRLALGTVGILALAVVVVLWASQASLRRELETQLRQELEREARLIQDALPEAPLAWSRVLHRAAPDRTRRVTLIGPDGAALADSWLPAAQLGLLGNLAEQPEVRAAMAGQVGATRRREAGEPERLFVAVPGEPMVRVASDLARIEALLAQSGRAVAWAALLALAVGTLLSVMAARAIARPLGRIADAARALPQGVAPRFPRSRIPEMQQLSQALRELHRQLGERAAALQEERAEAGVLVRAMVEGVLASDARGRIVTANPAARRMLGYGPADALPGLPELFRVKAAREAVDAALRGESAAEREVDLDGRIVGMNARPLPDGGVLIVLHDLTELRRLEAVRRDFLANVSHELKTPLTSISGYAETLLAGDLDAETRRRFVETILANARRMQRLVEDQLSLARIEAGRWQPRPQAVDVAAVAREVWAACTERGGAEGITFTVTAGPGAERLWADPEAVRQILGNLFDNAIRYTPPGGAITCASMVEDIGVALTVSDTGAGIGGEHLPRIFERYYRADAARSREAGGTGLGLAIVKHLVEAHGGRVWAESELGRGTRVGCWFPGWGAEGGGPAAPLPDRDSNAGES